MESYSPKLEGLLCWGRVQVEDPLPQFPVGPLGVGWKAQPGASADPLLSPPPHLPGSPHPCSSRAGAGVLKSKPLFAGDT